MDASASTFWVLSERSDITAFTTHIGIDQFYMWQKRPTEDKTPWARIFDPFEVRSWIILFLAWGLMSLTDVAHAFLTDRFRKPEDRASSDPRKSKPRLAMTQ